MHPNQKQNINNNAKSTRGKTVQCSAPIIPGSTVKHDSAPESDCPVVNHCDETMGHAKTAARYKLRARKQPFLPIRIKYSFPPCTPNSGVPFVLRRHLIRYADAEITGLADVALDFLSAQGAAPSDAAAVSQLRQGLKSAFKQYNANLVRLAHLARRRGRDRLIMS